MLGVAVLASVFARYGGYASGSTFSDGMVPAVWIGALVVLAGALAAALIPRRERQLAGQLVPELEQAA